MKSDAKIVFLDGIRGIACLFVILFHADSFIGTMTSSSGNYGQDSILWKLSRNVFDGNFAVCIFFILSGYVLIYKYHKRGELRYLSDGVLKRYFRLTPLVFVSVFLSYILWQFDLFYNKEAARLMGGHEWFGGLMSTEFSFDEAIWQGLVGVYNGEHSYNPLLWTIRLEMWASLFLFSFCALFFKLRSFAVLVLIASVITVCLFQVKGLYIALFLFGAVLLKAPRNRVLSILIVPALGLGWQTMWSQFPNWIRINFCDSMSVQNLSIILHVLASIMFLTAVLNSRFLQSIFSWAPFVCLGRLSFAMYVFHLPVMISLGSYAYIKCAVFGGNIAGLVGLLATLIGTTILAKVASRFIDLPSQNLASKFAGVLNR